MWTGFNSEKCTVSLYFVASSPNNGSMPSSFDVWQKEKCVIASFSNDDVVPSSVAKWWEDKGVDGVVP